MSCIAVWDLYIAVPHSDDNLTPVGIVPHDRKRAIPASPVALRSWGTMIVDQVSFVVVVLTGDSCLSAQCSIGLGCCSNSRDAFNAYPADHLIST
eukprot:6342615-Pyramimonas_sp.AAC.1